MEGIDWGGLSRDLQRAKYRESMQDFSAEDVLRWACGHPVTEHTRTAAQQCLNDSRAESISERLIPRHSEGGASAPPDAGPQPAPSIDTEADANEVPLPVDTLGAAYFCAEAARLVGGPRAATHGDKSLNFANIAELWNGYWRIKCRVNDERLTTPFTAHDVGCMMELLKIARRFSGSFNSDDYIDAAGYAGCTGEIAAKESQRNA